MSRTARDRWAERIAEAPTFAEEWRQVNEWLDRVRTSSDIDGEVRALLMWIAGDQMMPDGSIYSTDLVSDAADAFQVSRRLIRSRLDRAARAGLTVAARELEHDAGQGAS